MDSVSGVHNSPCETLLNKCKGSYTRLNHPHLQWCMARTKKSDIKQLAHVLREYRLFRKDPDSKGGGDHHKGLIPLEGKDLEKVAERVLLRDWSNRKAIASMFKMAESVERLLHLNLDWKERRDLGRLLISSLCYYQSNSY